MLLLFTFLGARTTEPFNAEPSPRHVCIYAYYEKNEDYKNNLRYFLKNGGLRKDVDYIFVLNGDCTVDIPEAANIKIIKRENKGYDFGAWANALSTIKLDYEHYVFINTSVVGPYGEDWLRSFMDLFDDSPDVKLVGTSINIYTNKAKWYKGRESPPYPHVQSMFFVLKRDALKYLLDNTDVFNETKLNSFSNIADVVHTCEIGMSLALLSNNWNINCILPKYRGLNYRTIKHDINPTSWDGDPYYPGAYFGSTIQKEDVVFYKSYRMFTHTFPN